MLGFAFVLLGAAEASPVGWETTSSSPRMETEAWWMGGAELVLVVGPHPDPTPSPDVLYAGPMGGLAQIVTQQVAVAETLLGDVQSGNIEVWHLEESAGVPLSGIIFAHRWLIEDISGGLVGVVNGAAPVYASDAVGMISRRRVLRFDGDGVLNFNNRNMCRGNGADTFLVECVEGGPYDSPDEIVAYLKVVLDGREGVVLPGAPAFQP
jgi:hypothetical protein